ncbi:MAG: hypothetical protein KKA70_14050 [Proteobacteria bacterium]|nr:hypothetical protein [Pseudomonadota bacterium]
MPNKRIVPRSIGIALCVMLLLPTLSACSFFKTDPAATEEMNEKIKAFAVLPVTTAPQQIKIDPDNDLLKGAAVLDQLLAAYFVGDKNVTMLSESQKEAMAGNISGSRLRQISEIGKQSAADAVLIVTLLRFNERLGSDYSTGQPATVAFQYELFHTETGRSLCAGMFEETQQSLSENLFTLSDAAKRGFKWITAEALAREGIQKKFSGCPYLANPAAEK